MYSNSYCFQVQTTPRPYANASQTCAMMVNKNSLAGSLATIRNRYDNYLMVSLISSSLQGPPGSATPVDLSRKSYWIGLNDIKQEGVYVWSSGQPITYSNWNSHQPDDYRHSEDCVEFWAQPATWNDNRCIVNRPFICQMPDGMLLKMRPWSGCLNALLLNGCLADVWRAETRRKPLLLLLLLPLSLSFLCLLTSALPSTGWSACIFCVFLLCRNPNSISSDTTTSHWKS